LTIKNASVIRVIITIIITLATAATLLLTLSTIYPMMWHPVISPQPNTTIANIVFLNMSCELYPGKVADIIGTNSPA